MPFTIEPRSKAEPNRANSSRGTNIGYEEFSRGGPEPFLERFPPTDADDSRRIPPKPPLALIGYKRMFRPDKIGLGRRPYIGRESRRSCRPRVNHSGGLPGFLSDFERFVDDKLTVIVMVNTTSGSPEKIALNVAGFYVPALAPLVLKPIPTSVSVRAASQLSSACSWNR